MCFLKMDSFLWEYISDGDYTVSRDTFVMKAAASGVLFTRHELSLIFEGRDHITRDEFRMFYENARLLN